MELNDIMTLSEVSKKYKISSSTLRDRVSSSKDLIEGIDYKKLGPRMPTIFSPQGVKKIIKQ